MLKLVKAKLCVVIALPVFNKLRNVLFTCLELHPHPSTGEITVTVLGVRNDIF